MLNLSATATCTFLFLLVTPFLLSATGTTPTFGSADIHPLPREVDQALTRIFFIGDSHGDSHCTKEWVRRTGLVNFDTVPWTWTGQASTHASDALVFLGDYVDKGVTSRGNLEFVRQLHQTFPSHVVAILGNHDLFALVDAVLDPSDHRRPMGTAVTNYAYAFVHPQEYVNAGWSPPRKDDGELLAMYMQALQAVYARNLEGQMQVASILREVPPFRGDDQLRRRMLQRLVDWETEYAQGLVDSGLAVWMASLSITAVVGNVLAVHGGVPPTVVKALSTTDNTSALEELHRATNAEFWVRTVPATVQGIIFYWHCELMFSYADRPGQRTTSCVRNKRQCK